MRIYLSDNYSYHLHSIEGTNLVEVSAEEDALQVLEDTIELAGQDEDDPRIIRHPGSRIITEGTAAMWIQFEILNML